MTTKERAALQNHINTINSYEQKADECFKKLQSMNAHVGSGHAWCCAELNCKELMAAGETKALDIYRQYIEYRASVDMLRELGKTLSHVNFWKQ